VREGYMVHEAISGSSGSYRRPPPPPARAETPDQEIVLRGKKDLMGPSKSGFDDHQTRDGYRRISPEPRAGHDFRCQGVCR
jgi:hypothetical protein